ncbi:MAG: hypothetical protein L3J42_04725 [Hydrogenimonas sp.]|nr:hypothetical protein [Hydrogenimonas sp.]
MGMKISIFILFLPLYLLCGEFRVATYNVENLFDLKKSGSEYTEYIPYTGYGWNEESFKVKLENISRVICDLKPDIIALQEIESDEALHSLQKAAKACGASLPYRAIADKKDTTVKCALLSKFMIVDKKEIDPDPKSKLRTILEVTVEIENSRLTLFINHWKSRSGPESLRLKSAKALLKALSQVENDYILLGDLNSNWNESEEILHSKRLNDTGGITGIGHILKTYKEGKPIFKRELREPYHTNLWLELPQKRRWSHNFYGRKSALDHIILPKRLFDKEGFSYVDRSFKRFTPYYLFKRDGSIFRWQRAKRGHGKHIGEGFSDHLPIYADFTTSPFEFKKGKGSRKRVSAQELKPLELSVAKLYDLPPGPCRVTLSKVAVIYKKGSVAILKEPGGRAITVYKDIAALKKGRLYSVEVLRLYNYRGLHEITKLKVLKDIGETDISALLLNNPEKIDIDSDLSEVVAQIEGVYKRGYLYYGDKEKIKLYFKRRDERPKNGSKVLLKNLRVGIYKNRPELVAD